MKTLAEIIQEAQTQPNKTIALACPEDREVLMAVYEARQLNLCDFILFGDKTKIKQISNENSILLDDSVTIIDVKDKYDACDNAVKAISEGHADVLMKGLIDTKIILKAALNSEYGLRKESLLSHVALCELPRINRLLFLSDGGMVIEPSVQDLINITINAINLAKSIKIERPKVALISAIEKVNPKMPTTVKCNEVQSYFEQENYECDICGPLAVDIALDKEAAKTKQINNVVAGNADILIVPYIEVGNALYKGWMFGCENVKSAGIIVGAKVPIILTSRADNHNTKLNSIALSVLM